MTHMASVYPRSGSKILECAFYVPQHDGTTKKVRRSTGTTNHREARRRAEKMEAEARKAAGLSGANADAIHAVVVKAGQDAAQEKLTVAKARAYVVELLQLSGGEEIPEFTVGSWAEEWLRRKRDQVSKATQARYEGSQRAFLSWLGGKAGKPLESVTTTHLRRFRDSLREGRTARTVNAYVKDVSSIFGAAVDEGLILANPAKPLKALPLVDSMERTPFTPEEVRNLLDGAPSKDWRGVILLGAYSGLRLRDCTTLTWGAVDLNAGTVTVIPEKTKRKGVEVRIPLAQPVMSFLEAHPISDDHQAPVFPSLSTIKTSGKTGLSMSFGRIMDEVGVDRGKRSVGGTHQRGFHCLRHTFTSWLANAGVSPEVRQAMTGHLDDGSHKLYTHHSPETLRNAIGRLPGIDGLHDAPAPP